VPSGGPAGEAVADSSRARGERGRPGQGPGTPSLAVIADPVETPESVLTGYQTHVGDPTFGASVSIQTSDNTIVSFMANAKAPLTDTASYGTGAWDVGGGASISVLSSSRLFASASGAFWSIGDMPDLELQDIWLGSLSLGTIRASGWSFAALLSGSSPMIAEFAAPVSVGASVSRFASGRSVGLSCTVGLTESASDVSIAFAWGVGLGDGS
jgi:hypothetical protein